MSDAEQNVGRTPSSAPDPLVRLFAHRKKPTRGSAAGQGARPTALAFFACISMAFAQSGASITGTVFGLAGDSVANAPVQITNTQTKAVYKANSLASGSYTIAMLPAGNYELSVDAPGFNHYGQQVNVKESTRLDIHLFDFQLDTLGDGRDTRIELTTARKTPTGPTPRTADGKPDFSGMWYPLRTTDPGKPEPLPWAAALMKERTENNTKDSPFSRCLPRGVALVGGVYPFKVVQLSALLIMMFEDWVPSHRQIFLDGRSHPKDMNPTWLGQAIGRWEGDTLVVDRAGFNDLSWIDNSGKPHTEKLHVTERFRRPDLGHLEMETTFDDPGAYAKPWTMKGVYDYAPGEEIQEFICNENNKDAEHMVGK